MSCLVENGFTEGVAVPAVMLVLLVLAGLIFCFDETNVRSESINNSLWLIVVC